MLIFILIELIFVTIIALQKDESGNKAKKDIKEKIF